MRRRGVNIQWIKVERPMAFYCMISLFIHIVLLTAIFIAGRTPGIKLVEDTVTVYLDNGIHIGDGVAGSKGGMSGPRRTVGTEKIIMKSEAKVSRDRMAWMAKKIEEPPLNTETISKEVEKDKAIPLNGASENTLPDDTAHAIVDFNIEGGGLSSGGGRGTGGYTSVSGFSDFNKGRGWGTGGDGGEGASKDAMKTQYLKEHFEYIRNLIMRNLTYPSQAKRMRWVGEVSVSFVIRKDGAVEGIKVIKSSGHKILDENVEATIRKVQPLPRPPVRAEVIIPVVYRLE